MKKEAMIPQQEIEKIEEIISHLKLSPDINKESIIEDLESLKNIIAKKQNVGTSFLFDTEYSNNIVQNSRYLKYIAHTINDLIWITDNRLNLTFITDSVNDFFGYTKEEFFQISKQNSQLYFSLLSLNAISENNIHERKIRKKDNTEIWIEEIICPQYNEKGELAVYVGVLRQINKRKFLEQKYKDISFSIEKNKETKTLFWANISHELRTPLNAIMGFTEVLIKKKTYDQSTEKLLEDIEYSGKNLLRLVNDILDLSKLETGELAVEYHPCNIYELVINLEQVFRKDLEDYMVSFCIKIAHTVPEVLLFDSIRFQQILFNLINNAIKFSPQGNILLSLEGTNENDNCIGLVVKITDNGIGIAKDQQEHIFEPFRRRDGQASRKHIGTGLGLSITKKLVTLLNGNISLCSEPDKGSTFKLVFSNVGMVDKTDLKLNRLGLDADTVDFSKAAILLVDDLKINRDLIQGILRKNNVVITEAVNGLEAVKIAAQMKPDLIIMDICMPLMDGIEASETIKEQQPEIPIILVSAFVEMQERIETRKRFDYYMPKPFPNEAIIQVMMKFLPFVIVKKMKQETDLKKKYMQKRKSIPEEAIVYFNQKLLKEWELVKDSDNFSQYISFAEKVMQYGVKFKIPEAVEYGKKLINFVSNFDIDKIYQTLSNFKATFQI